MARDTIVMFLPCARRLASETLPQAEALQVVVTDEPHADTAPLSLLSDVATARRWNGSAHGPRLAAVPAQHVARLHAEHVLLRVVLVPAQRAPSALPVALDRTLELHHRVRLRRRPRDFVL